MKHLFYFLLFASLISCNNNTRTKKQDQIVNSEKAITVYQNNENEELITDSVIETKFSNQEDDCIFDQTTQTDKFLIGIKEFENYIWDSISKTATIILDNKDTLLIRRGGCYHFGVSAEFRLRNDKTDYSDWTKVYERILWISGILETEFSYYDIKNEIDLEKTIIEDDYVYFSSEYLQDNNYEITRRIEKNLTIISLSYYIN